MKAAHGGANHASTGAQTMRSNGSSTMPGSGLAHLVSKFETLEKTPGANGAPVRKESSFPRQPLGLRASQTMSSLSLFHDNRRYFENGIHCHIDKPETPAHAPSPVSSGAAALARIKLSTPKQNLSPPKKDKDRISASVAEKRKFFEPGSPGSDVFDTTPKPWHGKGDLKFAESHSCNHIYSTPRTSTCGMSDEESVLTIPAPDSPARMSLSRSSLSGTLHQKDEKPQQWSIHTVPASSVVLRLHGGDLKHATGSADAEYAETPKHSTGRPTNVSSTGSPMKRFAKLHLAAATGIPLPPSPTSPKKTREPLATTNLPNTMPTPIPQDHGEPFIPLKPAKPFESTDTIVVAKKASHPRSGKTWSPQRIITPQKLTKATPTSLTGQSQGAGTFVKVKNPANLRDAIGFFEAMSHRDSLNSSCYTTARESTKRPADELYASAKRVSKRERLKGSLRRLSASWRSKQVPAPEDEKMSDYPAMWKMGSVEGTPRKRLHAEWCDLSADHRQPLNAAKAGEISLFDPYLSAHARSYRGGDTDDDAHVKVLLQETSLHGQVPSTEYFGVGLSGADRSRSPTPEPQDMVKPRRRSTRRWFSRSSGTLVSQAHCQLEQPRPVHGVEMKRLISLCKLQGTVKRRGHSE